MNKRFIITVTLGLTLLDWILLLVLFFGFDDHFPGNPPPSLLELAIVHIMQVLAFPLLVVTWLEKDPPYPLLFISVLFLVGAFIWAVVLERLRFFFRRFLSRRASA